MDAVGFRYTIDANDLLVDASPAYFQFAAENRWRGAGASLGEPLWSFVSGATMRRLQRALVRRVRTSGRTIVLPFRCDSPEARREMTIELCRGPHGSVSFTARLLAEQPRSRPALLDPGAAPRPGQVEMCGWCDRFLVDAQWVEVEVASRRLALTGARRPAITHGICPDCAQLLASA